MKTATKNLLLASLFVAVFLPKTVYAQDFRSIVNNLTRFVSTLIPILTAAALLVFFFGLAQYLFQAGDEASVETGRNRMIWGVIGLFFIAAIWGVVMFVGSSISIL